MSTVTLSVAEAKRLFSEISNRAVYAGERFIIERRGKPLVAVISIEDYNHLEALERSMQPRPGRYHEALAQARALREAIRQEYGVLPDSAEDIRAMREERDAELTGLR
jgi:prevent-host-death family protein